MLIAEDASGEKRDSGEDHQHTHRAFDIVQILLDVREEQRKPFDRKSCQ